MSQANQTLYISFDHLLSYAPNMRAGYVYIGNDNFLPVIIMPDVGEQPLLADSGLLLYRGDEIIGSEPRRYTYTFYPDAWTSGMSRKVNMMSLLRFPLGLLGRGPNRPLPWIDEHPLYKAYPVDADILLQTHQHPKWNRIKPLTEAGLAWVRHRSKFPGSDFTLLGCDGTSVKVPPKDFGMLVHFARDDGLSVWVY